MGYEGMLACNPPASHLLHGVMDEILYIHDEGVPIFGERFRLSFEKRSAHQSISDRV